MPGTFVQTYLNDHLAAASAGVQLADRIANNQSDTPHAGELRKIASAITEDRARLRNLMTRVGVPENRPKQLVARAGEVAGRLKPNGFVVRRSPLSDLLEVEALRVAVSGKRAGWRALVVSDLAADPVVRDELEELIGRAEQQIAVLEDLHQSVARTVLDGQH